MSDAPPLWNRPTWKVDTMVDPNEKVSGSTWVRWKLVEFVNGSELICVSAAWAATTVHDKATTRPAANAPAGNNFFICPALCCPSCLRDAHRRHDLLLVVRGVALVVGADERRDARRAAHGISEVISDEGPHAVRAPCVRRVQLRIEAVLGDPDVIADSLQVRTVELNAGVDAVVGRPIRRQAA